MKTYDPDQTPDAGEWLGTDEVLRIELVKSYHQRARIRLPNPRLHATFHVIVENQLAMAEPIVVATLTRLQHEGLSRHDAVHAIGSVLAEHIYELLKGQPGSAGVDPNAAYPHDFMRRANGNVLVGFLRSEGPSPLTGDTTLPGGHGGIAEFDSDGRLIRSASAEDPASKIPIRPYAFAPLPQIDRLLTTSAPMMEDYSADVV